jgi:hypothetical protein
MIVDFQSLPPLISIFNPERRRIMRSMLEPVSTFLFALSLALGTLAVAATNAKATETDYCAKIMYPGGSIWYCSGECPDTSEYCKKIYETRDTWICDCRSDDD